MPNLTEKKTISKFDLRPILGHRSDQVKVGHIGYHSIRGHKAYPFHSSITFGSKVMGKRAISP